MVGSDAYALTQDMLEFAKSLNLVIVCNNASARDSLPAYEGMVICRLDLRGAQETYVNGGWVGPSDNVIALSSGATTFENVASSIPLRVTVRSGIAMLTGRIKRASGTENTPIVGYVPVGARPIETIYAGISSSGAGNVEGSKFNATINSSAGNITLDYMPGSPSWTSQTWIPLSLVWPVSLLS